jgi:hypothetical protein
LCQWKILLLQPLQSSKAPDKNFEGIILNNGDYLFTSERVLCLVICVTHCERQHPQGGAA